MHSTHLTNLSLTSKLSKPKQYYHLDQERAQDFRQGGRDFFRYNKFRKKEQNTTSEARIILLLAHFIAREAKRSAQNKQIGNRIHDTRKINRNVWFKGL